MIVLDDLVDGDQVVLDDLDVRDDLDDLDVHVGFDDLSVRDDLEVV